MLRAAFILAAGFVLAPLGIPSVSGIVSAQTQAPAGLPAIKHTQLMEALRLHDIIEVVAAEGIAAGPEIEEDMFPGRGGFGWKVELERIYDIPRVMSIMSDDIRANVSEADADVLISFLGSPLGKRIVEGEVAARAAMLDEDVDQAATDLAQKMRREGGRRVEQIAEFIAAYDLVTSNVVGGLNSNYAFYQGLAAGGALPDSMTEDQIVNEVWSQQDTITTETEDWLYAYLLASYAGLSDDEMQTYIAFARTDAAQAFNAVLFDSFGTVFTSISRALGRAVADRMLAQDI